MEKTLIKSNNDKEFMRMAMLKHEETFREQVNELHRLYRIQKMLMESVEIKQHQQQEKQKLENFTMLESSKKPFTIDHYQQQLILQQQAQRDIINSSNITTNNINNGKSRINGNNIIMGLNLMRPDNNTNQVLLTGNQAQEHIAESNGNNNNNNIISNDNKLRMLDETEIELTLSLGPSSNNNNNNNPTRRRKPGKSESGQSISSSSTGSSQTRKTSPKDSMSTTTWGGFPHQGSGIEPGFSNGQQNSNPPWLYQALSLKLT